MMDLINRSDVIQILDENGWLYETNIEDLIKEIPTAYDVYKVVDELDSLRITGNSVKFDLISYDKTLNVVNRGGVYANVCEWYCDKHGRLNTECRYTTDNYPLEYEYCPYCGKKIKEVE